MTSKLKIFVQQRMLFIVKRQPTEWEKISVNYISYKALISRTYKELQLNNHNNNKIKQPDSKWAKDLNRRFSKDDN